MKSSLSNWSVSNGINIRPIDSIAERKDPLSDDTDTWTRKNNRPFSPFPMVWSKNGRAKRKCGCSRLEICLICLTIALIGVLFSCFIVWLFVFGGYKMLADNMSNWNSNQILSVSKTNSTIAIDSSAIHSNFKVCTSRECIKTAALFLSNIDDKSEDPCRDMFQFACKNYEFSHNKPGSHSTISDLQSTTFKQLKILLEAKTTNQDNPWDRLSKQFYSECMNEKKINESNNQAMADLLKEIGGLPLLQNNEWKEFSNQWEDYLADVLLKTGIMSIIMEFNVGYDPANSSIPVIELDQPRFGFELNWPYLSDNDNPIREKYAQLINDVLIEIDANSTINKEEILNVVNFESNLARFSADDVLRNDPDHTNNRFQLNELKDVFPDIDLKSYIKRIFEDKVNDNDTIIIREVSYFRGIQSILKQASKETIANYIGWRVIQSFAIFLPKHIRQRFHQFKSNLTSNFVESERFEDCISIAISILDMQVGRLFVEKHFDREFAQTKASQMIDYSKRVFENTINELEWIGDEAKERIIHKIKTLSHNLAYPPSMFDDNWMNKQLNYTISNEDIIKMAIRIKTQRVSNDLSRYKKAVDKDYWFQSPVQIDAFYSPNLNRMTIPAAIMQLPFIIKNVPNYINFAMLGTVISHELSHSLCSHGSKFDQNGNLKQWLDNSTLRIYKDKSECYIKQYAQDDNKGRHQNGRYYLSENMADNLALKLAHKAYNLWRSEASEMEAILSGFQNYTIDQMFFISYANNWCSSTVSNTVSHKDSHSSFFQRANIPLQNYDAFSEAFDCKTESNMNPILKCSVF